MSAALLIHIGATWAMVGVIWTVQLLIYPSMALVPANAFPAFERSHQRNVSRTLIVFAPLEVITGLVLFLAPGEIPRWMPLVGGLLLVLLWTSTAAFYAPLHGRLADGFDPQVHHRLVSSNWLRTIGWSARGVLVLAMLVSIA